jgi:hypothetical protein
MYEKTELVTNATSSLILKRLFTTIFKQGLSTFFWIEEYLS